VGGEQGFNLAQEGCVSFAGLFQEIGAVFRRTLQRLVEKLVDLFPLGWGHNIHLDLLKTPFMPRSVKDRKYPFTPDGLAFHESRDATRLLPASIPA
jgi:hypothetical protein